MVWWDFITGNTPVILRCFFFQECQRINVHPPPRRGWNIDREFLINGTYAYLYSIPTMWIYDLETSGNELVIMVTPCPLTYLSHTGSVSISWPGQPPSHLSNFALVSACHFLPQDVCIASSVSLRPQLTQSIVESPFKILCNLSPCFILVVAYIIT